MCCVSHSKSFNSLQTGKSFRTERLSSAEKREIIGFNSLQTGKSFRTDTEIPKGIAGIVFQFPSNGKVLSDFYRRYCIIYYTLCFNSLQTGKSFRTRRVVGNITGSWTFCFNSLQTGKSFRTWTTKETHRMLISFNSLQTGKSFRTGSVSANEVSQELLFQFPSNGKVLSDCSITIFTRDSYETG